MVRFEPRPRRGQRQEESDGAPSYDGGGGLSMTIVEIGIADRQWRLVERR
jgi:hypothetical protein